MNFSELQNLLKENLGIEHLADIARELNVSPQAVSNWKSRDKVPYKYVSKLRKRFFDSNSNDSKKNNLSNLDPKLQKFENHNYMDEENISLTDLLLILAQHLKTIIISPIIFCIITIYYLLFIFQPVYISTAKIMSSSGGSNTIQSTGLAAQFGINLPTGKSNAEWVYPEIIKSRTLAKAMLKRKFNTEKLGKQKSLLQILTYGDKEKPDIDFDILNKAGVNSFINMIDITKNSSFYDLSITASEPVFARDLVIALIDELDNHQRNHNKKKTSETRKFIEERINDTHNELEYAEELLKNFNERNRRIENSPSLQLERQRLSREVAVLTGVFTTLKQQLETSKIEEVKESDYVVVLDQPEAPLQHSGPRKKLMVILSGLFGIIFGITIAFTKEYINRTDEDDKKKMLQVKSIIINNIFAFLPSRYK